MEPEDIDPSEEELDPQEDQEEKQITLEEWMVILRRKVDNWEKKAKISPPVSSEDKFLEEIWWDSFEEAVRGSNDL